MEPESKLHVGGWASLREERDFHVHMFLLCVVSCQPGIVWAFVCVSVRVCVRVCVCVCVYLVQRSHSKRINMKVSPLLFSLCSIQAAKILTNTHICRGMPVKPTVKSYCNLLYSSSLLVLRQKLGHIDLLHDWMCRLYTHRADDKLDSLWQSCSLCVFYLPQQLSG